MTIPVKKKNWDFAIGTTSRVPESMSDAHYLIVDADGPISIDDITLYLVRKLHVQNIVTIKTLNGWHIYTDKIYTWQQLVRTLRKIPHVDQKWVNIGRRRGYYFLADRYRVRLHWPVERMVIHKHAQA